MRTIKTISFLSILVLSFACSNNSDDDITETKATEDLLTSGKWYQESKTPGSFSDCEKNSSFQFNDDGSLEQESFEENSGACEVVDINTATYTLNGSSLVISFGSDTISATINRITASELSVTDSNGDTVLFDKTQG
jgi:hypothetical protein